MKRMTRVISAIAGALSSLFTVGCMKPAQDVYGPPDSFDKYQEAREDDATDAASDGDVKPEFPESEGAPEKIYGPPEMLDGRAPVIEQAQPPEPPIPEPIYGPPEMIEQMENSRVPGRMPESDGIPLTKYGPPALVVSPLDHIPEVPSVPSMAPELQDSQDDAKSDTQKQDFEMLKEANESQRKNKEIYVLYGC
ncbi:MAG: hypothetical protein IKY83_03485 [Proteobacteria bacterium]|nr:hypothetical protein [Pseudomonadota bacterium]